MKGDLLFEFLEGKGFIIVEDFVKYDDFHFLVY